MRLSIRRVVALLPILFGLAGLLALVSFYSYLQQAELAFQYLDVAAQLRGQSTQVHYIVDKARLEERNFTYLREVIPGIQQAVHSLARGGLAYGILLPEPSSDVSPAIVSVRRAWASLEPHLNRVARSGDPDERPSDTRLHPEAPAFQAQVSALFSVIQQRSREARLRMFGTLAAICFGLGALLASAVFLLNRRLVQPVRLLGRGMRAIHDGDLAHRVPVLHEDELGELTKSFNEMARILQDSAAEKERMVEVLRAANRELEQSLAERRSVEERLRRSEARLASAQRIASVGNWEVDLQANTLFWSEEVYRIFGREPSEGENEHDHFWSMVHPDDLEAVREASRRATESGRAYAIEHRIVRPDGTIRHVREQAEITLDEAGRAVRMLGTVQDVTEHRHVEEQLRQSQKMEAVGQLAGGVAHDFNNLLTVITGYARLLHGRLKAGDPHRADVEHILAAGDKAIALTQQLLAFGRKQVLRPQVMDINETLRRTKPMLSRVIRENIELAMSLDEELHAIKADPAQIELVLLNLVINATDAMLQGGRILIETANVETGSFEDRHVEVGSGPHVMLAVSDNGVGMDESVKSRIFEPFFTTKEQGKGTGLGLPMVFGIVRQSGGHIWVYSEPGRGSTFKLYFPAFAQSLDRGPAAEESAAPPEALHGTETILLVEDDPEVREYVAGLLRSFGYTVLPAGNGRDALALAETFPAIDLLVTDVVMPRMGGPELAEAMLRVRPEIKVIYISGYTEDSIVQRGELRPGIDYLSKPFTQEALARKVRQVLERAPRQPRLIVADDDCLIREYFVEVLADAGYDVRQAGSAPEAIGLLRQEPADLVILDMMMPQMNGREAVPAIKGEFPHVRTMVVSGLSEEDLSVGDLGADAVLPKPVQPEILIRAVVDLVGPGMAQAAVSHR